MEQSPSLIVSVIVTAYNRRRFLLDAIKSTINQTLERDSYEVIVIKNFEDADIDMFIDKNGITSFKLESGRIGDFIQLGLMKSRGKIVCFLDDDDLFAPGKLRYVADLFYADNRLGFYHNAHDIIDENGEILNVKYHPNPNLRIYLDSRKIGLSSVYRIQRHDPHFNLSSITITGALVQKAMKNIQNLAINPDGFLYFMALDLEVRIMMDDNVLTHYRLHSVATKSNVRAGFHTFNIKYLDIQREYVDSYVNIVKLIESETVKDIIRGTLLENEIILGFITMKGRGKMIRYCREYFRYAINNGNTYGKLLMVLGAIFVIWPTLTSVIHYLNKKL